MTYLLNSKMPCKMSSFSITFSLECQAPVQNIEVVVSGFSWRSVDRYEFHLSDICAYFLVLWTGRALFQHAIRMVLPPKLSGNNLFPRWSLSFPIVGSFSGATSDNVN